MHPDIARLHLDSDVHEPVVMTSEISPQPWKPLGNPRSRDITKEFTNASAELSQGQLIKDDFFTLFESVGALEIMDPKMDSGFMMPEEDAIVDNFDPLKPMLPEEILGIMDQLLCYEMSWHDGYPLSQTLFTSLHLIAVTPQEYRPLDQVIFRSKQTQTPSPLISDVLRAFCVGLLKSCDSVIANIIAEHYYEEEDFVTQTFSQYLLSDIDDAAILSVLESASSILDTLDLSADTKAALAARLHLRALLLKAYEPSNATKHAEKTQLWQDVLTTAAIVDTSTNLSRAVPAVFSERVQRHLASNTPPRPMISITWKDAYPKLQRLCTDNIEAYRIATIDNPSPFNMIRFAQDFSSRNPQPSTYSRATFQSLLFKNSLFLSHTPHSALLLTSMRELVLAGDPLLHSQNWAVEAPHSPRHQIARRVDEFTNKAIEEFLNIPRMLSQNRCRQRRTLNQSIGILDSLQAEAEMIDSAIHEIVANALTASPPTKAWAQGLETLQFFPLAAWVYHHKLAVSEWTVLLGFETEVFLPDEMAEMYAFLAFLAKTREDHLSHIDFFAHRRAQRLARLGDRASVAEVVSGRAFLRVLSSQARATRYLSEGLRDLHALLKSLSLIPTPPRPYSTPALRHELRLKPFLQTGTPALPTAADLASLTTFPISTPLSLVLGEIEVALKAAKTELGLLKAVRADVGRFKGCEGPWGDEVRGLVGVCVSAGLAVVAVRNACARAGIEVVGGGDGGGEEEEEEGGEEESGGEEEDARIKRLRASIKVEIVDVKARWRAGWAVPKIVEVKTDSSA